MASVHKATKKMMLTINKTGFTDSALSGLGAAVNKQITLCE